MKVIKNGNTWSAISADGRNLSNGYPQTTPAAARRVGEKAIAQETVQKLQGNEAAIRFILDNF